MLPAEMCRLSAAVAGQRQPDPAGDLLGAAAHLHSRAGGCVGSWNSKYVLYLTLEKMAAAAQGLLVLADLLNMSTVAAAGLNLPAQLIEQHPTACQGMCCPASCFSGPEQPCCISLAGQDLPPAVPDQNRLVQQGWDDHSRAVAYRAG